jgi:hypothetical protein
MGQEHEQTEHCSGNTYEKDGVRNHWTGPFNWLSTRNKSLEFRINSSDPALISPVESQLINLRLAFPGWTFHAIFG